MPKVAFDSLPDHGRLWVFPASQTLTSTQSDAFLQAVDSFLEAWAAHGIPLRAGRDLRDDRFLVVGVDVDAEAPSGCSIDALVNRLRGLGADLNVSLIDHTPVWYRAGEEIRTVTRGEFRVLAESGAVDPETQVFDTSLTTIGSFRAGEFEQPAAETWHGPAFFKDHASS
jgi:hypothetical protein